MADHALFRRIALGMAGASESSHMGHPDFRVNGRIFATLHQDGLRGMVQLPLDAQAVVVGEQPSIFEPASGAWGRQGSTMVRLDAIDEGTLGDALTLAWQHANRPRTAKGAGRPRTRGIRGRPPRRR